MRDKSIHLLENIFSAPWEQKLASDILSELEHCSGERRFCVEEMRRFLAVKGYRDLLSRLQLACENKQSFEALRAAAHSMRLYALERPAMSAATFRTPITDTPEWRAAVDSLRVFMTGILSQCGLSEKAADEALRILRSLVRGFVMHEVMDSFFDPASYNESYDKAIEIFIAGLPVLLAEPQDRNRQTWDGIVREPEPAMDQTLACGAQMAASGDRFRGRHSLSQCAVFAWKIKSGKP